MMGAQGQQGRGAAGMTQTSLVSRHRRGFSSGGRVGRSAWQQTHPSPTRCSLSRWGSSRLSDPGTEMLHAVTSSGSAGQILVGPCVMRI